MVDAAGTHIYVWEPNGHRRRGFPVSVNPSFCSKEDQSQPLHHRKCGIAASPALAHLEGKNKPLDILKRIRIGVSVPEVLPPDMLADDMATRLHLMRAVLNAHERHQS